MEDMMYHPKAWILNLFHGFKDPSRIVIIDVDNMPSVNERDMMEFLGWLPQLHVRALVLLSKKQNELPDWLVFGCEENIMTENDFLESLESLESLERDTESRETSGA